MEAKNKNVVKTQNTAQLKREAGHRSPSICRKTRVENSLASQHKQSRSLLITSKHGGTVRKARRVKCEPMHRPPALARDPCRRPQLLTEPWPHGLKEARAGRVHLSRSLN